MNLPATSGLILTLLLHGGVAAGLLAFSSWSGDDERPALNMVTIEASLAYKSKEKTRQPQKKRQRKKRRRKPRAISRDENKKVEPKKEPEEVEEDFTDDFEKYMKMRQTEEDEELEAGEEEPKPGGEFDGSERGFAEVSKGDPYMQELAADVFGSWSVPTLEKNAGAAVGCVRLAADGSVVDTKLWQPTQNANIDRSVKLALKKLQEQRKPGQSPVPRHLMDATNRWTCFNFSVTAQ